MIHTSRITLLFLILCSLQWRGNTLTSNAFDSITKEASTVEGHDSHNNATNLPKRPILQPKETVPLQFTCTLKNPQGKVCVRASLGVEYVVRVNKKNYYYNLNPSLIQATGYCGDTKSVLSLDFEGGHLEFTFIKEGGFSYVKTIKGLLNPAPPCKKCQSKPYIGIVDHENLFKTSNGLSFKCKSETMLILANNFRVKLIPLQMQAFDLANGAFGKDAECWADYNKRMIPIILGAVAAAVCLIAILTFVLVRERRGQGYEQL
ncbi:lysosome-associated membrane glycoprotein 3 [Misgurnus anguillicaudatus]|uniref:lysosome-associated membrane glycoprotein 3 n=1 Tax=Misgurnus anguillicaudatus TaxID=75329 RepID=UPI002435D229|nr:lysosome-associated membrane glycoprotein 3 [Misgurnus anguillicaudatus]